MEEITNFLLSIGTVCLMIFIPYMIYTDIKYRTVSHELFYFIAVANIVPSFSLYWFNVLSWWNLCISLGISAVVFTIWKLHGSGAFSAADRNLLIAIAFLFTWIPWQVEMPWTFHNITASLLLCKFIAYFAMVCMFIPGILFAYNFIQGRRNSIIEMLTYYPRGVPFIVPIAAAFYLTVIV
jgi:hypothetical protein